MERLIAGLLSALRRAGVAVSPAEGVLALRAMLALGLNDRARLRQGLSAVLAKSRTDALRFDKVFDAYFAAQGGTHADLYTRLAALGFAEHELATLRSLLAEAQAGQRAGLWSALESGALALSRLLELAGQRAALPRQIEAEREGFWAMRMLDAAGLPRAETTLQGLRTALHEALGSRGDHLAEALAAELSVLPTEARRELRERGKTAALSHERLAQLPLSSLTEHEIELVEREVNRLAERLVGRVEVRGKRAHRGRLDPRKTLRRGVTTGGVPFRLAFRGPQRRPPELAILCDVSDSVRTVARLFLLFVHRLQRRFPDCRSFVFVSEVAECTQLFRQQSVRRAVELAYGGSVVSVVDNSQYGRAFELFRARFAPGLSKRTTLIVLGDARSNHHSAGEPSLLQLARRVGRVWWLNPEPEARWGSGDSAMLRYRPSLDAAFAVPDLAGLRKAVRALAQL